jgi:hypothetical protein
MFVFGILKSNKSEYRTTVSQTVASQIRQRILDTEPGSLFLVRDFLDLGSRGTVDVSLQRLTREGLIERVQHGIYQLPRRSALLGKPAPAAAADVAAAMARRTGRKIMPTQAAYANALGLTTQVPAKTVYRTNGGKVRRVMVGNQQIELRPAAPSQFSESPGWPIVQALAFVGEGNVTEAMVERMQRILPLEVKAALIRDWQEAPGWMHNVLQEMAR